MKNDLCWARTILTVYRYLERIAGAIDKIVMQRALGSSNIVGQNYFYNNTLTISEKLIELSERKVTLINLKVLIEDALGDMDEKDANVLIQKYVDGLRNKDLAESQCVGLRTIFRKVEKAELAFKGKIVSKGFNDIRLKDMLKDEIWINNAYNALANKDENFDMSNMNLAKAVSL